jgi:Asp-tRNA(Asn)/Glu-tRNA(Gln) amidotransferase A subunit family amidase
MADLHELGVGESARRIREGALSPVDLVTACLKRIDAVDGAVKAWVRVDRDAALRVAEQREAEARQGRWLGALHGIPVALKDNFDAAGLTTTAGAGPFAHRHPDRDAPAVARLRAAGAIVLGKTTTTAFAFRDPTATCNPWNLAHTPGGSSSGSAAAVGARMAPLALGTQTVGSVLRPAAYCGLVGLKPTYGRISTVGVVPLSWSLDHVGILARSVEDCALALGPLAAPGDERVSRRMSAEDDAWVVTRTLPPRLGVLRWLIDRATPEMRAHLGKVVDLMRAAGALVSDVEPPSSHAAIHNAGQLVTRVEAAAAHGALLDQHKDVFPPGIREAIEEGRTISAVDFLAAQETRRVFRDEMAPVADPFDALLSPTASGPAPRGLSSTGDASFCAPWSFAGMPSIALPSGVDPRGLPWSVQLTGGLFAESRLLCAARWCEAVLGFSAAPTL